MEWSAANPDHKTIRGQARGEGEASAKTIQHEGISLFVTLPEFDAGGAKLHFSVSSIHRKSVGLGAKGVALDADSGRQACARLAASAPVPDSQMRWNPVMRDTRGSTVMVSEFETAEFDALFGPMSRPDALRVIIEAKRLLAPNFIFVIPFLYGSRRQE